MKLKIGGDTFAVKGILKGRGYSWDGQTWNKSITASKAKEEIFQLTIKGILKPNVRTASLEAEGKEADREIYQTDKETWKIWQNPQITINEAIEKRGYRIYPFLNMNDYTIQNSTVYINDDCKSVFNDKIMKYRMDNPQLKLPRFKNEIVEKKKKPVSIKKVVKEKKAKTERKVKKVAATRNMVSKSQIQTRQSNRTHRARGMDQKRKAKKVVTKGDYWKWMNSPNRYDILGIDTP